MEKYMIYFKQNGKKLSFKVHVSTSNCLFDFRNSIFLKLSLTCSNKKLTEKDFSELSLYEIIK